MKSIKPANNGRTNILKGVSTLDVINMRIVLLFLVIIVFSHSIYAGHSILDRVDPSFNPNIVANLYDGKIVNQLQTLPDGKILAYGLFNSYNRVPTGNFVRLNADGSLDTTFNNQLITSEDNCGGLGSRILTQPNGKIILACSDMVVSGQAPKSMLRLNADGTLDTSFNFTQGSSVSSLTLDSLGRILLNGSFQTPQGTRKIVRLNDNGSFDSSFNFTGTCCGSNIYMAAQGNRLIVGDSGVRIFRLNENGMEDLSFTALLTTGNSISGLAVQPDNKILYLIDRVRRLNENGGIDNSFQSLIPGAFTVAGDGKITLWAGNSSAATFYRFLPDGTADPSFTQYTHHSFGFSFTVQPNGGVITGDYYTATTTQGINNFIRLTPGGVPDPTFNPGGVAFQTMLPGSIRAIEPLSNGKVFLGGKFDLINNITCPKIARLNADSSVDPSFQINTSGSGNRFSLITDVYHIHALANGKIVVSGWFDYVQDGVAKKNLVRLNSDGSIDTTFNLTETIHDWSVIVGAGRNPLITFSDGKLMIGISRLNGFGPVGPLKFNEDGSRDTSFTSVLNGSSPDMFIDDLVLQPDGKIVVAGSHDPDFTGDRTFIARLNANGSADSAFPYTEEKGRLRPTLALLPNGKILVGRSANGGSPGTVKRLNPDGSPDASFNSLSIPGGIINALLVLPNGKIFAGGKFTLTISGQPAKNLLQLDEDGSFASTTYNLNDEVLCLAADSEGRVLVGGGFTVIGANGAGENRSYVARLTDGRTPFDFDGDGRTDVGIFRPWEGNWYLDRSTAGLSIFHWGIDTDRLAPADYDGDGMTDLGIYRDGQWWYFNSGSETVALTYWGTTDDIPMPSDFDGDGKADFVYFQPSTGAWCRKGSTGVISNVQFGLPGDIPLIADFDGDGKADPTIFRPSDGVIWYMSSVNGWFYAHPWGQPGDIPVLGDYDGDGKTDAAVFRDGFWRIFNSGDSSATVYAWGYADDRPTPGDYDGDGKTDFAIYRPSNGMWFAMRSTSGFFSQQFGLSGDKAVPNAFLPDATSDRSIKEK
ncbi:MAG TPA: FG-GAP-like repeat-containing protein [Pyrinomonadaceae bacterium]|nr:FG-GAP-like repeat-containing protein [Pyrinomonadaceae bacterium]